MKIKTKLFTIAVILFVLSVVIVGVVFTASNKSSQVLETSRKIDQIVREIFRFNTLMSDYLLHYEDRAQKQLQLEHAIIANLLQNQLFYGPEDQTTFLKITQDYEDLYDGFLQFANIAKSNHLQEALKERFVSQASAKFQSILLTPDFIFLKP